MNTINLIGVNVDVCPVCRGVWLDEGEMKNLISGFNYNNKEKTTASMDSWLKLKASEETNPAFFWKEESLTCTKDGVMMKKHYFSGTKIGLDHCLACKGFWLDGPELKGIFQVAGPNEMQDRMVRVWVDEMERSENWHNEVKALGASIASGNFLYLLISGLATIVRSLITDLDRR